MARVVPRPPEPLLLLRGSAPRPQQPLTAGSPQRRRSLVPMLTSYVKHRSKSTTGEVVQTPLSQPNLTGDTGSFGSLLPPLAGNDPHQEANRRQQDEDNRRQDNQ